MITFAIKYFGLKQAYDSNREHAQSFYQKYKYALRPSGHLVPNWRRINFDFDVIFTSCIHWDVNSLETSVCLLTASFEVVIIFYDDFREVLKPYQTYTVEL